MPADIAFPFERLEVWQSARELVRQMYAVTTQFPAHERFGLCSQINRAAVSVATNLAEGASRTSLKDQAHFSQLAFGSLMELACLIRLSGDLHFCDAATMAASLSQVAGLAPRISKLRDSQLARIKNEGPR